MPAVVIVGGGFAGVWAAAAATRLARTLGATPSDLPVTLVTPGNDLVIRPRLYEARPEPVTVPLRRILHPIGVRHLRATVTRIDTTARTVRGAAAGGRSPRSGTARTDAATVRYDRLVLAAGSQLDRPQFPGSALLHSADTLDEARRLEAHLQDLAGRAPRPGQFTAVVAGAGFTGLKVATELVARLRAAAGGGRRADAVRVILVDRSAALGTGFGPPARDEVIRALDRLGIERRLRLTIAAIDLDEVTLSDGTAIPAATVVWAAGMRASPLTSQIPGGRDRLGRLLVDRTLRAPGAPAVLAAGDAMTIEAGPGPELPQSCQLAIPLGRYAGHNAAASLLGAPLLPFTADSYVTCLDLGAAGAIFTTGPDRVLRLTGDAAKAMKHRINHEAIYPPADDAAAILGQADPLRPTTGTLPSAAVRS